MRSKSRSMTEHEASRTLVKSPPELWAECSDAASLARHLAQFGEIRITRLEPETAVVWEGEHASGTVRLEPSGWGTRVILTACAADAATGSSTSDSVAGSPDPISVPDPSSPPDPISVPDSPSVPRDPISSADSRSSARKPGLIGRLLGFLRRASDQPRGQPPPAVVATPPPPPAVVAAPPVRSVARVPVAGAPGPVGATVESSAVLVSALDSLGQAHHRPFSRA
jgi:hypothetical protein